MRPTAPSFVLLCLALLAAACTSAEPTTTTETVTTTATTTSTTSTTVPGSTTTVPQAARAGFLRPVAPFWAGFPENPLLGDTPPYSGPTTPATLDDVLWADEVEWLGADALGLLAENGFMVVDAFGTQFHELYSGVEQSRRQPLFVTTDAAYHYWHLAFAKALRDTEQTVLLPVLEEFADRLLQLSMEQAEEFVGAPERVAAATARASALAQLLVAVLGLEPGPHPSSVTEELALIDGHLAIADSPTSGALVDYTLFVPRGHYTRTPDLTRYFLGMSLLGNTAFLVSDDDQMLTALMLGRLLSADQQLAEMYQKMYEPTAFLVGFADDYTPFEAAGVAEGLFGEDGGLNPEPDAIEAIRNGLLATRQVAIDPTTASVRVMGARFVLDSYILDQLVYPNVESRLTASPLDVAAAFGSEWAYEQLEAAGETADPDYEPQLAAMRTLVADREAAQWAGTVYDAWLYALQPSWIEKGAAYPDFMRTAVWTAKSHQTGFGSYTELKHDTVLYAKQAFAEGEGPPPPPAEPRHWVEPDPVVYARLAALARLMAEGLGDRDLLATDVAALLDELIAMYERFERLARDELAGRLISTEDNAWLETIASRFELMWLLATEAESEAPGDSGGFTESPDDISAVIVDIMSNPNEALEIATGLVDRIYVLVPNDEGRFQVARGGVYSYYEFWVPRGERMTDEEWRAVLYDWQRRDEIPDRPPWTEAFFVDIDG